MVTPYPWCANAGRGQAEHDENELRKSFTVTERLAIAQRIAERLQGRHGGDRKSDQAGNISGLKEVGDNRDLAAAKAGLGSGKTLEAAQKVVEQGVPELVEAMDAGKVSIHAGGWLRTEQPPPASPNPGTPQQHA